MSFLLLTHEAARIPTTADPSTALLTKFRVSNFAQDDSLSEENKASATAACAARSIGLAVASVARKRNGKWRNGNWTLIQSGVVYYGDGSWLRGADGNEHGYLLTILRVLFMRANQVALLELDCDQNVGGGA